MKEQQHDTETQKQEGMPITVRKWYVEFLGNLKKVFFAYIYLGMSHCSQEIKVAK